MAVRRFQRSAKHRQSESTRRVPAWPLAPRQRQYRVGLFVTTRQGEAGELASEQRDKLPEPDGEEGAHAVRRLV